MNNIKTLGIDLAKNSCSLVGMNAYGKFVLRKTLSRKKLLQPMCLTLDCSKIAASSARG